MNSRKTNVQASGSLLYRWDDAVLSFSCTATTSLASHFHGAAELAVGLHNPVRSSVSGYQVVANSILIPPGIKHQNCYADPISTVLYLDPESHCFTQLAQRMSAQGLVFTGIQEEPAFRRALQQVYANTPTSKACHDAVVTRFITEANRQPKDARVATIAANIRENPATDTSIKDLAAQVALSEDRLHHLFTREMGIPVHKYRLWLRLKLASRHCFDGHSLTFAAQASGFADAAHFSRTFLRMYGASPSKLLFDRQDARVFFA